MRMMRARHRVDVLLQPHQPVRRGRQLLEIQRRQRERPVGARQRLVRIDPRAAAG